MGRSSSGWRVNGRETFGRIAVISDRLHDEKHGDKLTWFGFFEARDQPTGLCCWIEFSNGHVSGAAGPSVARRTLH